MKPFFSVAVIVSIFFTISCTESTEPEQLFKYTQRSSAYFDIDTTINHFVVKNPIGFVFLYGVSNQTRINYTLDKTVWVKSGDLANGEFNKIGLKHSVLSDSILSLIDFPSQSISGYYCTMNLDIPYGKKVYVRNPNDGVRTSYLESDLFAETTTEECLVDGHSGSLEAHTTSGNIISQLIIPTDGYCKCYSVSGDITIRIPIGSVGNVHLKTTSGSVSVENLNITTTINTSKEIIGTLGTGNEIIYLESTSGVVKLIGF
jgi:hypothetical protein